MMAAVKPSSQEICSHMVNKDCIRNICILAHVDHGKTTLADSLLATNRLVSKRLAGSLRYLDDREDEQKRGITMKSSGVSLLNSIHDSETEENSKILVNLIDTPGHIDFSSEVSAALRVCDGAIILVDVVEGVCVQTKEAIKQAFEERTKMILVLNKLDKLIIDLKKDVDDIFQSILRCIENCNATIAELYHYECGESDCDIEDSGYLFSPDVGNVVFASAVDGWAFTTRQVAEMFIGLVKGETVDSLDKKMWDFDNYVDGKNKVIKKGATDNKKPNLFIQFCLKTIHYIYSTIVLRMEKDKLNIILEKLGIKSISRDMNHTNHKVQVRAILQAWKPLAETILIQCKKIIPSPNDISIERVHYLLNRNKYLEDSHLNKCVETLLPNIKNCVSDDKVPTVAYVSKMFCVTGKSLSQNKPRVFIPGPRPILKDEKDRQTKYENANELKKIEIDSYNILQHEEDIVVIGMARVFSGNLKIGQEMYLLSSTYIAQELENDTELDSQKGIKKVIVAELYMLFGRELVLIDNVPAGNICGIGGLEGSVIRTATLSSIKECVPIIERPSLPPVVRNAVEPVNPKELSILRHGLRMLMQSDSCVQVITQETGEHVLVTAGDVHLAKCLEDLTSKFAKIEINVSSPMVSLRETITDPTKKLDFLSNMHTISVKTTHFRFEVGAVPLPEVIAKEIETFYDRLHTIEEHQLKASIDIVMKRKVATGDLKGPQEKTFVSEVNNNAMQRIKKVLSATFASCHGPWPTCEGKIWSIGKMSDSINLLINYTETYQPRDIFHTLNECDARSCLDSCIVNAFSNCCKAGPLCEEPLMHCAFIVKTYEINPEISTTNFELSSYDTAGIDLVLRCTFREAFEKQNQRIMEPIFTTDIQVNPNILGKVYTVVNKRQGKVLDAVGMDEEEKAFMVKAQIPVIESIGFANEIRKTTSGQAFPILKFSHYEIVDGDPFYEPAIDDADEDDINIELAFRASKLRKDVRRRKGLPVEDQVVIHAEKQRTLNKKK